MDMGLLPCRGGGLLLALLAVAGGVEALLDGVLSCCHAWPGFNSEALTRPAGKGRSSFRSCAKKHMGLLHVGPSSHRQVKYLQMKQHQAHQWRRMLRRSKQPNSINSPIVVCLCSTDPAGCLRATIDAPIKRVLVRSTAAPRTQRVRSMHHLLAAVVAVGQEARGSLGGTHLSGWSQYSNKCCKQNKCKTAYICCQTSGMRMSRNLNKA